jgi:hypothetical protein
LDQRGDIRRLSGDGAYLARLNDKGRKFVVGAWKKGDQPTAIGVLSPPRGKTRSSRTGAGKKAKSKRTT